MVARRAPASPRGLSPVPQVSDVTLQINLCAGDLAYGDRTVAALIATHRADVREVVVVADGCRPHSTPLLDASAQFPAAEFAARVERLRMWCAALLSSGSVDRVVWLQPEPTALRTLNAKYCGVPTPRSHDHLGHAFSAYFLGWESARTRYLAHFDADIVLWQEPGFHWLRAAVAALEADASLLAASPLMRWCISMRPAADGCQAGRSNADAAGGAVRGSARGVT
jgi:hypothetical protein